jgi:hypothetical protein
MQNVLQKSRRKPPAPPAPTVIPTESKPEPSHIVKPNPLRVRQLDLTTAEAATKPLRVSERKLRKPVFIKLEFKFYWKKYLLYFPVLILGIMGYAVTGLILFHIEPRSIEHVILPHSFLPLLLSISWGNFFFFSYLFLNVRRSLILTILITIGVYLRIIQVLPWGITIAAIILYAVAESFLTITKRAG